MDRPGGARRKRRNFYLRQIFAEKFKGWQTTAVQTLVEEMQDFVALTEGRGANGAIASGQDGFRAIEIAQSTALRIMASGSCWKSWSDYAAGRIVS